MLVLRVLSEIVSIDLAAKYQVKCSQPKIEAVRPQKSISSSVLTFYLLTFIFQVIQVSLLLWWSEERKVSLSKKGKFWNKIISCCCCCCCWSVGLLVCWFVGLFGFVGLLVCWFVGLLVCWFAVLLVCWFVWVCFVRLFQCMTCGRCIVRHDFWNSPLRCTALCNGGLKHRQAAIYLALKKKHRIYIYTRWNPYDRYNWDERTPINGRKINIRWWFQRFSIFTHT